MKKKPSTYKEIVENNLKQLIADGKSEDDIDGIKKMKPGLHFRKSKKPR